MTQNKSPEASNGASHLVIGFDARENWRPYPESWPQGRKDSFLLRVWPSIFHGSEQAYFPQTPKLLERPDFTGQVAGLWEDFVELKSSLASTAPSMPYRLIAITLVISVLGNDEGERNFGVQPKFLDPSWKLLGYDVSDGFLLSGLSNCGYSSSDILEFRKQFGSDLNENHLFSQITMRIAIRIASQLPLRDRMSLNLCNLKLLSKRHSFSLTRPCARFIRKLPTRKISKTDKNLGRTKSRTPAVMDKPWFNWVTTMGSKQKFSS